MNIYERYNNQTGKRWFKLIYENPIDNYIEFKRRIRLGLLQQEFNDFQARTIEELLSGLKQ